MKNPVQSISEFKFESNNFDLIRLLAATQVLIVHAVGHLQVDGLELIVEWISLFPGVPVFFVISGYLISESCSRSNSYVSYARNRLLRIYPALLGCFLVTLLIVFVVFDATGAVGEVVGWVLAQITFAQFYNPEFIRPYGVGVINGSLWTIPVELQFYLLLPFLMASLSRIENKKGVVIGTMVLLVLVSQSSYFVFRYELLPVKLLAVSIAPYLAMFCFGWLLRSHPLFIQRWLQGKAVVWMVIFLATSILLERLGFSVKGNYQNALTAGLLGLFTISFGYTGVRYFGDILRGNDISYGVYIYHMLVVNVLVFYGHTESYFGFGLALLVTLLLGFFSWRLIEKPSLRLKKRSIRPT
jgi:peptidoglycan/LPS O-acetylase OafA/YrhL